jgi:tetratricopeptide (TPR) repeat protein
MRSLIYVTAVFLISNLSQPVAGEENDPRRFAVRPTVVKALVGSETLELTVGDYVNGVESTREAESQLIVRSGPMLGTVAAVDMKSLHDAIVSVNAELQKTPDDASLTIGLSRLYLVAGKPEKTLELLKPLSDIKTASADALWISGSAHGLLNHADDALRLLEAAAEKAPTDERIMNSLAWFLVTTEKKELRDPQRAVRLAAKACEMTQWKDYRNLDTLATAHAEADNLAEAHFWHDRVVELAPDRSKYHFLHRKQQTMPNN